MELQERMHICKQIIIYILNYSELDLKHVADLCLLSEHEILAIRDEDHCPDLPTEQRLVQLYKWTVEHNTRKKTFFH